MNHSLKEIKKKLLDLYSILNWTVTSIATNPGTSRLNNCNVLRNIIEDIEPLGLFENKIKALKDSVLFTIPGDNIKSDTGTISATHNLLESLKDSIFNLTESLNQVTPAENAESINIKLPPVSDFNDLSNVSKDLHVALSQVLYLDEINSTMKIESVENGSIWLNVSLYSSAAIAIVGNLVWASVVVYKAKLEGSLIEEQLRAYKIRNDSMEDVKDGQKKLINNLIQAEADHINSESFKENIPENVERIKHSISLLADLLNKGAEIHPALVASKQVSDLFPDMKKLPTIESKVKQIGK